MSDFDPDLIVRLENTGEADFVGGYDNRTYRVPANASMYVPIGACCGWLGNVNAVGGEREFAVEKIRAFYGYTSMADTTWEAYSPRLAVWDQMTGERIWFPADDPDDIHGSPARYGGRTGQTSAVLPNVAEDVRSLQEQVASLREALGHAPAMAGGGGDIPVDSADKTGFRRKSG